ncbi:Probable GMP synthase [glutamine-hydrolyzing] [Linum perenne]
MPMSVVARVQSDRAVLVPAGNRARVPEESKRKNEAAVKKTTGPQQRQPQQFPKPKKHPPTITKTVASKVVPAAVKSNVSVDSVSSSDESFSSSGSKGKKKNVKPRTANVSTSPRSGNESADAPPKQEGPPKRCDWITPNSNWLYACFHDEEWGVPVHDDRKLLELLVFSQALAELSWPEILHLRHIFRKLFDDFDATLIAQYTDQKLLSLRLNGHLLLSEPKLRAIVGNAQQILKIQQEFGSFSSYLWRFVNNQPVRNGFRYARQVPAKTPKAELISKDLMQRGFRCVGPTVVYCFMEAAGIVNDHLLTCFRYHECNIPITECNPSQEEAASELKE